MSKCTEKVIGGHTDDLGLCFIRRMINKYCMIDRILLVFVKLQDIRKDLGGMGAEEIQCSLITVFNLASRKA